MRKTTLTAATVSQNWTEECSGIIDATLTPGFLADDISGFAYISGTDSWDMDAPDSRFGETFWGLYGTADLTVDPVNIGSAICQAISVGNEFGVHDSLGYRLASPEVSSRQMEDG